MPDIEKVLSWLESLAENDWRLFHSDSEVSEIAKEALALLKEQPEIIRCKDCKFGEACKNGRGEHGVMCYNSHSASHSWVHEPDWFCADGERAE